MRILYASSEIAPYASSGGMGEFGGALPTALATLGVDFLRVMPLHRGVAEGSFDLQDTGIRLDVPVGFRTHRADVWESLTPEPKTLFIRRDEFFDRTYLYSLPERDYDDNFERFVFFQKAVISLLDTLGWNPDVVHCNDWQTGLIPLFLQHGINGMGRERREKCLFTIHNLAYQGIFPGSQYSMTNLPFFCFNVDSLEFYGNVNSMKGGITGADAVTTVSRTYAEEIQTEAFGYGLHGVISKLGERLSGITNGADYTKWDPADDPFLARPYSATNRSGKKACKRDLIESVGLTRTSMDKPLLGMVTRLVDQKGLDILEEAMPSIMENGLSMVILGGGLEKYEALCDQWMGKWPDRFVALLGFDECTDHRVQAGADILLVPSRSEPCGLAQLHALRYGTIPVVHATGGLEDTVEDIDSDGRSGTGFKFRTYTAEGLMGALVRSLAFYDNTDLWGAIMQRAMQSDFSWSNAAEQYHRLYHRLLS